MKIKLVNYTPLSVAVVAGRSAWNSFHKGGKYKYTTDNITETDYNFLNRLFNKFKHVSVSEHIFYEFEFNDYDENDLIEILSLNDGYFLPTFKGHKLRIVTNLRWFFENKDKNLDFLINQLPFNHQNLIKGNNYSNKKNLENGFEYKIAENKLGHKVILLYKADNWVNLRIKGISRGLSLELNRHDDFRAITQKSSRYTLKELRNEKNIINDNNIDFDIVKKYCVLTNYVMVDTQIAFGLNNLQKLVQQNIANDVTKYAMIEAYRTEGVWSFYKRSLDNLLKLRLSKDALWEFQELAKLIQEIVNKTI